MGCNILEKYSFFSRSVPKTNTTLLPPFKNTYAILVYSKLNYFSFMLGTLVAPLPPGDNGVTVIIPSSFPPLHLHLSLLLVPLAHINEIGMISTRV